MRHPIRILLGNPTEAITFTSPLVSYLGGSYFFAPSISFFKSEIFSRAKSNSRVGREITPKDVYDEHGNLLIQPGRFVLGDHREEIIKDLLDDWETEKEILNIFNDSNMIGSKVEE